MSITIHGNVMKTQNYAMFRTLEGNREVNSYNMMQIMNSMGEKQLVIPIVVNEKFEIIDGQHRFTACKNLKLPVYYIMENGYDITDVIRANVNGGRKWFDYDYLLRYCSFKDEKYLSIKSIVDDFGISTSDYLKLVSKFSNKTVKFVTKEFQQGNANTSHNEQIIEFLITLQWFNEFKYYKNTNFMLAYVELYLRTDFNKKTMESKVSSYLYNLKKSTSKIDYLDLLCNKVYSFGKNIDPIYYNVTNKQFYKG